MLDNRFNDLTIAFSGYNMKEYCIVAIESFLYHYPKLKDSIVWFDDNSKDGTVEWLKKKGIKVITWKFYKHLSNDYKFLTLSPRNVFLIREIMEQCPTRFLFMQDGDTATIKGGFLEDYFDLIDKEYRLICYESLQTSTYFDEPHSVNPSLLKYKKYSVSSLSCLPRIFPYHILFDLDKLEEIDLSFDTLEDDYLCKLGLGIDTGTDFFYQLKEREITYYPIKKNYLQAKIIHFTWIASRAKIIEVKSKSMVDKTIELLKIKDRNAKARIKKYIEENKLIQKIIDDYDLDMYRVFDSLD